MKTTVLIGTALLTFACGGGHRADTDTASSAANASSAASSSTSNETVAVVGCLRGPAAPGATGTAGNAAADRARARATGNDAAAPQAHGVATAGRFRLVDATTESGGVGANGAGASGGPLVSPRSSFELDGLPADAQASVDKQVRITGRVDSRPVGAAHEPTGTTGGASASAASGSSTRDDVRANSTTVASADAAGMRRLTVETVKVVAESCAQQ